jgi:proteic killer suppression protein
VKVISIFPKKYLYEVYLYKVHIEQMAILSFSDKSTEEFFVTGRVHRKAGWVSVRQVAQRKLDMIHYAHKLSDLKVPPGNRLEELKGDLAGCHSIRINDQWRIVFRWSDAGPSEVRIDDYQ